VSAAVDGSLQQAPHHMEDSSSREETMTIGHRPRRFGGHNSRREQGSRVLIIVQNLTVPLDRRVWLECQALVQNGYAVSVICPKGPGDPSYQLLDGVHLHKYKPPPQTHGKISFVVEYVYCWLQTLARASSVLTRRGFDAIQTCNPPDTYFLLAALLKPFGVRFVFDQHDLCPEMYFSRFGKSSGLLMNGLYYLERRTYALADHIVTTNESYKEIATSRGGQDASAVTIVRSGPDHERMRRGEAVPALKKGREELVCWLGIMGPQDGVDVALRAAHHYVHELGRDDCHFAFLGFGDAFDDLVDLTQQLDLNDWVTFTGRAGPTMVAEYLSTADVGLVPDPNTPYAQLSTHNKTMEYMAFELPVVTFDLKETRVSAGDAAFVVTPDDAIALSKAIAEVLDDPDRRQTMGRAGRQRIVDVLSWSNQAPRYVDVYNRLLRDG
jgi:glycosyltransferase involved in cell wall biosynthesis